MKNQNVRFKELIRQGQLLLNMSAQKLKDEYDELIRQIDNGTTQNTIEIRLNEENITLNCFINKQKQCRDVYFFFDKTEGEDAFINYLVDYFDYSFRKKVWLLDNCIVGIEEIEGIFSFHIYK